MTPLVRATLAFATGTLMGLRVSVPPDLVAVAALVAFVGCLVLLKSPSCYSRTAPKSGRAPGAHVLALFGSMGLLSGADGAARTRTDCRAVLRDGAVLTVRGAFEGAPGAERGWLRIESASTGGTNLRCRGTVRTSLPARGTPPPGGVDVLATGTWWVFPVETGWPVAPERRGMLGLRSVRPAPSADHGHPLLRARASAQLSLRALFPRRSGLAEALLVAQRDGIDDRVKQDFAASGLTHLLAISGSHVALVAGVLVLLAGIVRVPATIAAVFAAVATVGYVLFLGAPHAAARAALQILLVLAARLAQRPCDPFTLLAFAALILIALDPLALLDAGFQLSFAGIYGLLSLRRPLMRKLPSRWPAWLRDVLASGTAATLATTPIAALHFGLVALVAIPANLIAIPLVGLCVPAITLALTAAALLPAAGHFLASGGHLLLAALERTAAISAAVPLGHGYAARSTVIGWLGAGAVYLVVMGIWPRARPTRAPALVTPKAPSIRTLVPAHRIVAAAAALTVLVAAPGATLTSGDLEIHAIDVGQGDAFAIRTPGGRWILVDAGPFLNGYDAGRMRVVPFLLRRGVTRVDAVVLTHPHADHIGGTSALLEAFDVDAILDPAVPYGENLYAETIARAGAEGTRWLAAHEGRELRVGEVTVRILAPIDDALDGPTDPNDYSVVLRLSYGRFAALFLGDAPRQVENELVGRLGPSALASDVLKVGHHGSRTSTGDSLLDAVRPRVGLVSVGRWNRYGHPDAGVIERMAMRGVRVLRTDLSGTITVRVRATGEMVLSTSR